MSAALEHRQDLPGSEHNSVPFGSLAGRTLAQLAILALILVAILDAVGVISSIAEIRLLSRMINGAPITYQEAAANDHRQAIIGWLQLGLYLPAAALFLAWIYRAHKNLRLLNVSGLKYSPGWAVWGFFIPFLNWWRPFEVTKEIWKASDPTYRDAEGKTWHQAPVGSLLPLWWALWLASGVAGWVAFRSAFLGNDLETLRTGSIIMVVANACSVAAALPAMFVIRNIVVRQEEKLRSLGLPAIADPLPARFRLQAPGPAAVRGERSCNNPACGGRLQPDWRYCAYCLARVEPQHEAAALPVAQVDAGVSRALLCANPRCGRKLRAEWGFCPYCDTPRMRASARPSTLDGGTGTRIHTALQD